MAELDLGKVTKTDDEINTLISIYNGGVRFGKDSDGKPGYIVADPDTGADTVIPFSSGGSGGGSLSGIEVIDNSSGYWSNSATTYHIYAGSTSGVQITKDYKYFLLLLIKFKDRYLQYDYITNVDVTTMNTSFDYTPSVIVSAGNLTEKSLYTSGIYLLNGASAGSKVGVKAVFTLASASSNYKYWQATLYGIN